jgi:alpha-D-xyloside xylohydrolase
VRPNSVIAAGSRDDRPDYDYGDGVTLQVYELADGERAAAVIPSLTGDVDATFEVRREEHTITVEPHGATKRWQLLLMGIPSVASVEGGAAESTQKGTLVTPVGGADGLRVLLGAA